MDYNLKGKVAIITGAGRGIGRVIALTLCREGADVVIDDIDLEAAKLVEEEAREMGGKAVAIKADVTKLGEVSQMVQETLKRFGKIDILVNNAGIRIEAILAGDDQRPEVIKFWKDRDEILKRIPLPRIGLTQDVANLVAFLSSDVSSYITGQNYHINGGRFMS